MTLHSFCEIELALRMFLWNLYLNRYYTLLYMWQIGLCRKKPNSYTLTVDLHDILPNIV